MRTCFLFLLASAAWAQPTPTPNRSLLILSKVDRTLAIVDPSSLAVLARVPVGEDPHEVVVTADGRTAYASNTGSGRFHQLSVVDLVGQKPLPAVDTGAFLGPHGLAMVDGKIWFTAQGSMAVARYDPARGVIDQVLGTGQERTHMLRVRADQKWLVATNVDSGSLSFFENVLIPPPVTPMGYVMPGAKPELGWRHTIVPVEKGVEGFDLSPDGRELWTATPQSGHVFVMDRVAQKVVATLSDLVLGVNRVKFTLDGKRVLISSARTGELVVFDAASRREQARIPLGKGATEILLDPEDPRAFVACTPDHRVAVVDLVKLTVTGYVEAGGRPDGMAWAVRP